MSFLRAFFSPESRVFADVQVAFHLNLTSQSQFGFGGVWREIQSPFFYLSLGMRLSFYNLNSTGSTTPQAHAIEQLGARVVRTQFVIKQCLSQIIT